MFKHITDNYYIVSTQDTGSFPSSYSFFIDDDIKTLIDTPLDKKFIDLFTNRQVDMILNTHFHRDHSGCNFLFPDAKVFIHDADAPAMESVEVFCDYYGLNEPSNLHLKQGFLDWLDYYPSQVTGYLADKQIIKLGQTQLEVLHTPGHTPGHCAFYDHKNGVLLSGDIDLTGFGPWYGNAVSNVDDVITSIERIIDLNPEIILSGHKGIIDKNVKVHLKKYLDKVYQNEDKILQALQKPLTLNELTEHKIIYGKWGKPTILFSFFEKISLEKHLDRLIRLGLVNYTDNYYVTIPSSKKSTVS